MNRKLKSCHRVSDYLNYIKLGTAKTLSVVNHIALTLARAGGGDAAPIEKLMGLHQPGWMHAGWIALKFCIAYGTSFVQIWETF